MNVRRDPPIDVQRIVPAQSPEPGGLKLDPDRPWEAVPQWTARWLYPPQVAVETPFVGWFRLRFKLERPHCLRFSVTADERYDLWLDGKWIGSGPDRGDRIYWYYATYDAELAAGEHELLCRVWALGKLAPIAQHGVKAGILLAGHGQSQALVSTGFADWRWQTCQAWRFARNGLAAVDESIDGTYLLPGDSWDEPAAGESGNNGAVLYPGKQERLLVPSELPAMRRALLSPPPVAVAVDDAGLDTAFAAQQGANDGGALAWTRLFGEGQAVCIGAGQRVRVLADLGRYCCGRVVATLRGGKGAMLRSRWAEAAGFMYPDSSYLDASQLQKAARDAWRGGLFRGFTDAFRSDGREQQFSTLWWRSGRWLVIEVTTAEEPLTIAGLAVEDTGYGPGEFALVTDDPQDASLAAICLRTLQCCAHETTMDCPHYEQLAYAGDARVQLLCWERLLPGHEALCRHTLRHFHASTMNPSGWSASSAPSRGAQLIPAFSLWWILIASDYLKRSGDIAFLRTMLPAWRNMAEKWLLKRDPETGLCRSPDGWNFVDAAFPGGVPDGAIPGGYSGLLNWIVLHALVALQELEAASQEPLLATRWKQIADELLLALIAATWDDAQGIFLDAPHGCTVSEHAQALAMLYPNLPDTQRKPLRAWLAGRGEGADPAVIRCQAFFCYYLFAAMEAADAQAVIAVRLEPWRQLLSNGFTTTPEHFGETRSDCHAWSAHPLLWILRK